MTRFSRRAPERAERVFDRIPDDSSQEWVSGYTLMRTTGMSMSHVYEAIAYIREHYPEFSLVSHPVRGYRFTTNEAEIVAFRNWRVRSVYTILGRLWTGTLLPFVRRLQPDRAAEIESHYLAFMTDLEHMLQSQTVS